MRESETTIVVLSDLAPDNLVTIKSFKPLLIFDGFILLFIVPFRDVYVEVLHADVH